MGYSAISNYSPLLASRLETVRNEAHTIYKEMAGKEEKIDVKICDDIITAAALSRDKTLFINPLFLISADDLPPHLKLYKIKENSTLYYENLRTWLNSDLGIEGAAEYNLDALAGIFDRYVMFWNTTVPYDRIKKFLLSHEVAHLFHQHQYETWDEPATHFTTAITAAIFFAKLPLLFALTITTIVYVFSSKIFKVLRLSHERKDETQADLTALNFTKDFEGAKAYLECIKASTEAILSKSSWANNLYTAFTFPEKYFYLTHPRPEERLINLRAAHTKA